MELQKAQGDRDQAQSHTTNETERRSSERPPTNGSEKMGVNDRHRANESEKMGTDESHAANGREKRNISDKDISQI